MRSATASPVPTITAWARSPAASRGSKQQAFLDSHHVSNKTDCATCWARPICAGGCYHEANTRYGSTERPNLHYCEWIRGWTHTCLEIYGELAERNPGFLAQFDDEPAEKVS